ncbi:MAG: ABC transporter ATP-binding protein [Clostridiales bacterium]|nr:ABC transporter ATP-binding protein [Clostridiales bacterium]
MSHSVIIDHATKYYGEFLAVDHICLDIAEGEFFTLLGPSGCGKTTLLRMIAGFNSIEEGTIRFDEKVINQIPAHKRDIGMVFQNYAIFPHLTVAENVAYGLKARKTEKAELTRRVTEALKLVQIEHLKDRKPNELSGGQQQRVALARAFVVEPTILLMDEPLPNLDAKLRVEMRTTIKKLQKNLGITTIYVTHDQEEALAISDRIAVMKNGVIMQVGTPDEIYKHPENAFVAGFIGVSNLIDCEIESKGNFAEAVLQNGARIDLKRGCPDSRKAILSARPEQLYFGEEGVPGIITLSTFLGDFIQYEIELEGGSTVILNEYTKDDENIKPMGQKVHLKFNVNAVSLFDKETGEALK